jgi:tetratricopeptide (TPR) repeat protein
VELFEKGSALPQSLAMKINLGKMRNLLKERGAGEDRLMGKYKEERERLDKLASQFCAIGEIFDRKGQEEKAFECYHVALMHNPSKERAHLSLARLFYKGNDFSSAIRELRALLSINPFNADAHALLAAPVI